MTNSYLHGRFRKWLHSNKVVLSDCYNSWSELKTHAYAYCQKQFNKFDGKRFRIVSSNGFAFSVGFVSKEEDEWFFYYITKSAYETIKLTEEEVDELLRVL